MVEFIIIIRQNKIGDSYNLQPNLPKQEMDQDEIFEDTWEDKEHEWLPYLKNDVSSIAFSYARYAKGMEDLTYFGMKNSLTLPSPPEKYFNSLRDENDETIYTYNDECMRYFVRQSLKGGRCAVFNQYYESTISDEVFNYISKGLDVNGNICEILDKYFKYENKHEKNNKKRI